ncbi:hypothetical protein HDE69_001483 [Pedobacter cryoconitis]|uniref:Uncharacterized protein n=1 Tax=Pedobacter cryoconitis TaxID=188932 RepID=A0A7W8YRH4_9SPHI|nr:hypothetical protein [Pedobacter cryoconitis]MBB5620434.1 hypothetical protein [Pedobacter cryoconitis]
MSKYRISLIIVIIVAAVAGILYLLYSTKKETVQPATTLKSNNIDLKKDTVTSVEPAAEQTAPIYLKISSFQSYPSIAAMNEVEKTIRQQLPLLNITQRYLLLEQWEKALTPMINRLAPEQQQILAIYKSFTNTSYLAGESSEAYSKRINTALPAKLNPAQKILFQQLTARQIEITEAEEQEPAFELKPAYWKNLFASRLTAGDQYYWNQQTIENNAVIDYDAGLAVDRVTLGEWASSWESYLKKYPEGHYQKEAEEKYRNYMSYLLVGLENTPTLNLETYKIEPDVIKDFETIIKRHPNSTVANSITSFRKTIQDAEGKINIAPKLYELANTLTSEAPFIKKISVKP